MKKRTTRISVMLAALALLVAAIGQFPSNAASAQRQGSDDADASQGRGVQQRVANRGDIRHLPDALRARLVEIARRPHTFLPITVLSEADDPSQLFQYYLIDTNHFQPNIFTSIIPGINDTAIQTGANAANGGLPTIGAVRVVLEPKPGLPTDPNDVRAFIDVFTDVSGLFVINNESGWYEGWMIRDVRVPRIAVPHVGGRARYGTMTPADAAAIAALGTGNNVPGHIFSTDGLSPRFGSPTDVFPDPARQPNIVPFPVSIGAFNAQQQSDVHAYWEFNPGTNWVFPHYELPFTGGVPGTFAAGLQYNLQSVIPGDGPPSPAPDNDKLVYGDNPDNPRDPDRTEATNPARTEFRNRFIPSGLTEELLLNVFVRVTSFMPGTPPNSPANIGARLLASYAAEVARVDQNHDGVISFEEANVNGTSDGLPNTRLYLPATAFNRFAITREINDGLLAPRFAPSQRAYIVSGFQTLVNPSVPASVCCDADRR